MLKKHLFIIISLITISNCFGQTGKMYQFYNKKGKAVSFENMAKSLLGYDVILYGEYHNNSTNHWLQLQLAKYMINQKGKKVVLGAEMFERDNQEALNKYLSGLYDDQQLKETVRLWSNYNTDYKPLVDLAKTEKIPFIATNIPRRYASVVAKRGLDDLNLISENEKKWIVKLPFPIDYQAPGYPEMLDMIGNHDELKAKQFIAAQAIKDATMAESILHNIQQNSTFIHFNGDYHSKNYGGIYWYLKNYNPLLKVAVIQIVEQNDFFLKLTNESNKNFIFTEFTLVLPEDTIKTYY